MPHTAASTHAVVVEQEMPHPTDKSGALKGALIEEWLMKNDFQPVVGHSIDGQGTFLGEVDGA